MTLNRAQSTGLDLSQLERAELAMPSQKYLDEGRAGKYIFLYHAMAANAPVHVFALFFPDGPVKLHVVDPATRRQPITRLSEAYAEFLKKRLQALGNSASMDYPSAREFATAYHGNDVTALKAISRELGLMENRSFTVVLSSMKDQSYFDIHMPKLAKFPVLNMPKARAAHSLDIFPWQSSVAQKLVIRYLTVGTWLDQSIALADYYDIPVGHLEGDQPLLLSDIDFARRLTKEDMVLWWSPGELPDLGGVQDDKRPSEPLPGTEFLSPGCYFNVCLEIRVRNLAVNAVLHSVIVNELEGSGGATAFDSTSHTLDEYAGGEAQRDLTLGESNVSPKTFGILKNMVKTWLLDKIQSNNSPASLTVDHFWRWISSSISHMHDPSIHRFVHGLMRKTFIQLLAEYKRLGSHVVYADLSRILLVTSKPPGTAHAYATYINTAVQSNELFQHVWLKTDRFYDFLLFMDPANLGGVVCEDPLAVESPQEIAVEMRWNIQSFLPLAIQKDFAGIVRYFIVELYRSRQKSGDASRTPLRILPNGAPDATQRDAAKSKEMELTREFVSRRLTRKLLRVVGTIQDRHKQAMIDGDADGEWEFPVLPGSHLQLFDPVLEFVKFVCAILMLAKDYQLEVGLLRRNLLELTGVREFSNDAVFRQPCEPLKLSNVPCKHCDSLRDFDFCRDAELLPSHLHTTTKWLCETCGGEYDRTAIELSLVDIVLGIERTYAQQDLRCTKCKQIQSDNVSRHCHCSGSYQVTISKADVRRRLRTIVNVAILHNLHRLKVCDLSSSFRLVLTLSIGMRPDRTQLLVIIFMVYSFDTMLEHPLCFRRIVVDSYRTSQSCCTSITSISQKCIADGHGTPILVSIQTHADNGDRSYPPTPSPDHQKALVLSHNIDVTYYYFSLRFFRRHCPQHTPM
jgi:DNA polymerase epsilon subunit 1